MQITIGKLKRVIREAIVDDNVFVESSALEKLSAGREMIDAARRQLRVAVPSDNVGQLKRLIRESMSDKVFSKQFAKRLGASGLRRKAQHLAAAIADAESQGWWDTSIAGNSSEEWDERLDELDAAFVAGDEAKIVELAPVLLWAANEIYVMFDESDGGDNADATWGKQIGKATANAVLKLFPGIQQRSLITSDE